MRDYGLPKILTWRWTPCAALTFGAASFAAFALLVIPDHIGELGAEAQSAAARLNLGANLASTQTPAPAADFTGTSSGVSNSSPPSGTVTRVSGARPANFFPKRGFSPPLERPDPPRAPAPPPPALTLQLPAQAAQPTAEPVPAPTQAPPPQTEPPSAAAAPGAAPPSAEAPAAAADPNAPPERSATQQ